MQRRTLIVGNWKMNKTIAQARELVRALQADTSWDHPDIDVVVAPPFTALAAVAEELKVSPQVALCAQTMHWADHGAYTGEIAPPMLCEIGCRYVLLGHSERRECCAETDETVNRKVKAALAHGIIPIIAVGESLDEHKAGQAKERVTGQVLAALEGVDEFERRRCVLAYEPLWAIGTGLAEDPSSADNVMAAMRASDSALEDVQILYGGSMKPSNAASLTAQPNIDGGLIGGASLDAKIFAELIRNTRPAVGA